MQIEIWNIIDYEPPLLLVFIMMKIMFLTNNPRPLLWVPFFEAGFVHSINTMLPNCHYTWLGLDECIRWNVGIQKNSEWMIVNSYSCQGVYFYFAKIHVGVLHWQKKQINYLHVWKYESFAGSEWKTVRPLVSNSGYRSTWHLDCLKFIYIL